jgi:hypothetical protein
MKNIISYWTCYILKYVHITDPVNLFKMYSVSIINLIFLLILKFLVAVKIQDFLGMIYIKFLDTVREFIKYTCLKLHIFPILIFLINLIECIIASQWR